MLTFLLMLPFTICFWLVGLCAKLTAVLLFFLLLCFAAGWAWLYARMAYTMFEGGLSQRVLRMVGRIGGTVALLSIALLFLPLIFSILVAVILYTLIGLCLWRGLERRYPREKF